MTKPRLVSSSTCEHMPRSAQKSFANVFEGRGRSRAAHRRAYSRALDPCAYRASFTMRWGAMVRHLFATREDLASAFCVTFQTACNWWCGTHRPTGDKVAIAALTWPEEFSRFMGE